MTKLSVGVLGLGLGRYHVGWYADCEHVGRLVVCDPDEERVRAVREAYPRVVAAYASLDEMLAAERLDAISVTTPDHLHRPHAVACLQAGCHVLLAKPIATTLEDARAIIATEEAGAARLMLAHERRYRVSTVAIKRLLNAGAFGEVIHLTIDSIQDKREQFRRAPWYAAPEAGRSAIVGSGIHQVDLVRYLVGQPVESVMAYANRLGTLEFPRDKTTAALFHFASGAIGQVTVSYEAHWPPKQGVDGHAFRLIGTKGVIMGDRAAIDGQDGWQEIPEAERPLVTGVLGCLEAFVDSLVHDKPMTITGRDAYDSLAAAIAADESALTGRAVVPARADF
ncbi:MAG: Gfo/Idh/MocA family oxidoreductase [Chloroflexi bacterium]|nr:Gfo/Idh/MocA family oxidoreductase [Chloroflexota bacterium]